MLKWIVKPVASPYGSVDTLHWAVPEDDDADAREHRTNTNAEDYGNDNPANYYPDANGNNNITGDGYYGQGGYGGGGGGYGDSGWYGQPKRELEEEAPDAATALQVELDGAEDQLGAVLWNSNTAALNYLHTRILSSSAKRTGGDEDSANGNSAKDSSAVNTPLRGMKIVELGAGVGCLGIALAMGGAAVAVSDLKELLPLMRHNIRINRRSITQGGSGGKCLAMEWKWGPSVSVNPRKYATKSKGTATSSSSSPEAAMLDALRAPSAPMCEVTTFFNGASSSSSSSSDKVKPPQVDLVVLCDALYGNPKDWPALLYTLSELLAANPRRCKIVNFCEQRVSNVEDAFLSLLEAENAKTLEGLKHDGCGDNGSSGGDKAATDGRGRALERVLLEKRGGHRWVYSTEALTEAQSDLNMTIRATTIRWEAAAGDDDEDAPARKRAKN